MSDDVDQFTLKMGGSGPFLKFDVVRVSRLGSDFAMSFHQIDYHAAVEQLAERRPGEVIPTNQVARLLCDPIGLERLHRALTDMRKQIPEELLNAATDAVDGDVHGKA